MIINETTAKLRVFFECSWTEIDFEIRNITMLTVIKLITDGQQLLVLYCKTHGNDEVTSNNKF